MFDGSPLYVSYFEPKELRELHKLEELDKKACELKRQRAMLGSPLSSLDQNLSGIVGILGAVLGLGNNNGGYQNNYSGYRHQGYQQQPYQQRPWNNNASTMGRRPMPRRNFYGQNFQNGGGYMDGGYNQMGYRNQHVGPPLSEMPGFIPNQTVPFQATASFLPPPGLQLQTKMQPPQLRTVMVSGAPNGTQPQHNLQRLQHVLPDTSKAESV